MENPPFLYSLLSNVPCSVSVVMLGGRTSFALHRVAATLSIGNSDDMLVGAVIVVVVVNMGVFGWCAPTYKFAVLSCECRVRGSSSSGAVLGQ